MTKANLESPVSCLYEVGLNICSSNIYLSTKSYKNDSITDHYRTENLVCTCDLESRALQCDFFSYQDNIYETLLIQSHVMYNTYLLSDKKKYTSHNTSLS